MSGFNPEDIIHQSICDDLAQMDIELVGCNGAKYDEDAIIEILCTMSETAVSQLKSAGFIITRKI